MDFTGDLEIYQDRVAIACGVPKSYLDQEFGGFGNSGISLVEQYKPFARHVYTIQSSFLESLGQLIRLHFAITGEFDYNIPFVLSMRFPAEDAGADKREARSAAIELANGIIEMLQGVLGMEEGEPLPEDVVSDILSKYTFLDPTDLQRWLRLSAIAKAAAQAADPEDNGDDEDGDGGDMGDMGGDDMGMEGDDGGDEAGGGDEMAEAMTAEERKYYLQTRKTLREKMVRKNAKKLKEKSLRRLQEVSQRYKESRNEIYFNFLKENHFTEWQKPGVAHELLVPTIKTSDVLFETFVALQDKTPVTAKPKLREMTVSDMLNDKKEDMNLDKMLETKLQDIDDIVKSNGGTE
jgi:hypothetical protein